MGIVTAPVQGRDFDEVRCEADRKETELRLGEDSVAGWLTLIYCEKIFEGYKSGNSQLATFLDLVSNYVMGSAVHSVKYMYVVVLAQAL